MKEYISRLNWAGFLFVMCILALGALGNKTCTTFTHWVVVMGVVAIPISLLVLFVGKKPKRKP